MEDDELIKTTNWRSSDPPRSRLNPYNILMRQSRIMGHVATKTYDVTKEFLKRDVSSFQPHVSRSMSDDIATLPAKNFSNDPTDIAAEKRAGKTETTEKYRELMERGAAEEAKKQHDQDQKNQVDLEQLVHRSHQILAEAKTVILPVNLFPDTICVDRTKVTIELRSFFWSAEVISVRIEDVLNVSANYGPFFGSLMIATRIMNSTDHYTINYLWRKDALHLKRIIQGYVIAQHNNIDVSHLSKHELIATLRELGTDV